MTENFSLTEKLSIAKKADLKTWRPIFYDLNISSDKDAFSILLDEKNPIITDEIFDQIKELVKCQNPRERLGGQNLIDATLKYINDRDLTIYGLWTYYPWSNRLVHILGKEEFIKVRTNRNHYKISPAESEILLTKKIGLVGLSVGQSVAVTLAMERGFGELRLADFDDLELTNLNRIRTGIHNLGLSKVISVAREIMEIDPFLKLKCFTEGLTEDNFEEFFTGDGNLDLFIDECDGLDMKVLSRFKAREMKIPVVMEASDRGMVDVERFDLEPNRPLLHGTIGDLNPEKLKTLETNEDKIPYMLAIVGSETISTRAKASMLEIGETITTWPQLASAVTLGGGITADVVRRIFLNQYSESGRYFVDVEDIIGDKKRKENSSSIDSSPPLVGEIDFGPKPSGKGEIYLTPAQILSIGKAACHAPSGGNLQPWRWSYTDGVLQLKQDEKLISSFLDHNYIASYIALGASIENAVLQAVEEKLEAVITLFPNAQQKDIIANIQFKRREESSENEKTLGESVFKRHTNRNIEKGKDLKNEDMQFLLEIARKNGSELLLFENGPEKEQLGDLIAFAERFRILHPTGHKNFIEEMRWSEEEANNTRDGIDINTVDLTVGELTGFRLARHREVIDKLVEWKGGTAFEKLSRKSTSAASAIGIITRPQHSREDFLNAGRDLERVWIGANSRNIGFQPQSPISLILQRLKDGNDLNQAQLAELQVAGGALDKILKKKTDNKAVFIFRLFYAERPVVKSLRRDLNQHFQHRK